MIPAIAGVASSVVPSIASSVSTAGLGAVADGATVATNAQTAKKVIDQVQMTGVNNSLDMLNSAQELSKKVRL